MDSRDDRQLYDRVGTVTGWDFSRVQCVSEGVQWDLYDEVSQLCKKSDILLDIGTGGGERILAIADAALLVVGIDRSAGMMETALHNLANSGAPNVRFLQMDAEKLEFPDRFFQVISCRHSNFCANEVSRVLAEGGVFLTQQIGEGDKFNLKEAFGRGQSFGTKPGTLKQKYVSALSEAGFTDIQTFEYNATEYYKTVEDLIFLLTHTPIIGDFGHTESDYRIVEQFVKDNLTDKGIRTNSERFMIAARKFTIF